MKIIILYTFSIILIITTQLSVNLRQNGNILKAIQTQSISEIKQNENQIFTNDNFTSPIQKREELMTNKQEVYYTPDMNKKVSVKTNNLESIKDDDVYYKPNMNKAFATGVGIIKDSPPLSHSNNKKLENVEYVKEISNGGRLANELNENGDTAYLNLLNSGYENPTTTSSIYENKPVNIDKTALLHSQSVEFHKPISGYDAFRYETQANFNINQGGVLISHP